MHYDVTVSQLSSNKGTENISRIIPEGVALCKQKETFKFVFNISSSRNVDSFDGFTGNRREEILNEQG
jgi:hypothetical protein